MTKKAVTVLKAEVEFDDNIARERNWGRLNCRAEWILASRVSLSGRQPTR
jgi:hypothetical protein